MQHLANICGSLMHFSLIKFIFLKKKELTINLVYVVGRFKRVIVVEYPTRVHFAICAFSFNLELYPSISNNW